MFLLQQMLTAAIVLLLCKCQLMLVQDLKIARYPAALSFRDRCLQLLTLALVLMLTTVQQSQTVNHHFILDSSRSRYLNTIKYVNLKCKCIF
jgi:hypothetical protein